MPAHNHEQGITEADNNIDVDTEKNSVTTFRKYKDGADELESKKSKRSKASKKNRRNQS